MSAILQLLFFVCLVTEFTNASNSSTPYQPCKNIKNPIDLRVKDCKQYPCDFVQGQDVVAEMDFLVENDSKTLKPEVIADAMGMSVPYQIEPSDGCKSLVNGECPVDKDEELTYRLIMNISPQFPTIEVVVQLSLIDESGSAVGCFRLPGRVVPPRN